MFHLIEYSLRANKRILVKIQWKLEFNRISGRVVQMYAVSHPCLPVKPPGVQTQLDVCM